MAWTDERMDDFAAHTYRRFDEVDRRLDGLERRMDDGFNRVDADLRALRQDTTAEFRALRSETNGRFDEIHRTIHRTMLQLGAGAIVTLVVGFAGIIVTQL